MNQTDIQNFLQTVNVDAAQTDALILNPYATTLKKQIFQKLEAGLEGEAIDLLLKGLKNEDEVTAKKIMEDIAFEAEYKGYNSFAGSIREIIRNNEFTITPPAPAPSPFGMAA